LRGIPCASRSRGRRTPATLAISRTLFAVADFGIRVSLPKTSAFINICRRFIPGLVFLHNVFIQSLTVWIALIGWSFTSRNNLMIPLGGVVIIGFWLLEGLFRGIQTRYIDRSGELTRLLNDREALDRCFESQEFPSNVVYPMTFRETEISKLSTYGRGLIAPSVATLYLFLAFVNYLIWMVVSIPT